MSEFLAALHFLHPGWLWGLAGVPLVAWLAWRRESGRSALARIVDADLLPHLLSTVHGHRRWRTLVPPLVVFLAVLALAGPAWERLPATLQPGDGAQVLALSLSRSMLVADVVPNRLARARYKLRDMIDSARGDESALVAYAGDAFVVAPLTSDADTVLNLLDALAPDTMPVDGNDASRAIDLGVELLAQAGVQGGDVVLVTDAVDPAAPDAASRALAHGVHVSVLGIGSTTGGPVPLPGGGFLKDAGGNIVMPRLDADALRAVATAGGGSYHALSADDADVKAMRGHAARMTRPDAHAQADLWRDRGPWLLLPLLPLMALMFRRGWLLVLVLVLGLPVAGVRAAAPAEAASVAVSEGRGGGTLASWWDALWRNRDQRAAAALDSGDIAGAAALAKTPALRAAADYRAEDFDRAAAAWRGEPGADAAYNRGNALARGGHYEDAITAYDHALELEPGMDDAVHNRALVEQALQRQQQDSSAQDGSKNPSSGQDDSSSDTSQTSGPGSGDDGNSSRQQPASPSSAADSPQAGDAPDSASSTGAQPQPGDARDQARDQERDDADAPPPPDARDADQDDAARQQMQQALGRSLDEELDKNTATPHQIGVAPTDDDQTLPASMRQALERVPDDPGGLLRRKFQREYRMRQQSGGETP